MKFFAFLILSLLLVSCAESSFELADNSPLPHYFQIPDSTERSDYTVEYKLYQNKAELSLYSVSTNKKLAEITGNSTRHPSSKKHKVKFEEPHFSVFDFNGEKEFFALIENTKEFSVVHETDIVTYFDSIGKTNAETFEVNTDVELNNGKKWQANPETVSGIANLQTLIANFNSSDSSDSLSKLSTSLETEFKLIFKNCTMTGAAHDQLHNYLLPMLGMMKKLKTPPLENQQRELKKMEMYLLRFENYFE